MRIFILSVYNLIYIHVFTSSYILCRDFQFCLLQFDQQLASNTLVSFAASNSYTFDFVLNPNIRTTKNLYIYSSYKRIDSLFLVLFFLFPIKDQVLLLLQYCIQDQLLILHFLLKIQNLKNYMFYT